jgi:hypothetical protein
MRSWTHSEEEALRILGPQIGGPACAEALDRSVEAVRMRAKRLGVSLGKRRTLDPILTRSRSEAVLRRIRELTEAELCPACGKRLIGVKRTGLCGRCHFQGLVAVHEEEIARLEGQRELWAARSKLRRRRRELGKMDQASDAAQSDDKTLDS